MVGDALSLFEGEQSWENRFRNVEFTCCSTFRLSLHSTAVNTVAKALPSSVPRPVRLSSLTILHVSPSTAPPPSPLLLEWLSPIFHRHSSSLEVPSTTAALSQSDATCRSLLAASTQSFMRRQPLTRDTRQRTSPITSHITPSRNREVGAT